MKRRTLLKWGMAGVVLSNMPAIAAVKSQKPGKKFVWIILRGAMDSLHAVVPMFDKNLKKLRGPLVEAIEDSLQPLANGYGLHPALKNLHQWYQQGEFLPVVAVASAYRERSHFDAQDILECGKFPVDHDSGWLARALQHYQGNAVAIARSIPITLRGSDQALTWYPSNLPEPEGDIHERLMLLYQHDSVLHQRLAEGITTRNTVRDEMKPIARPRFANLAEACGKMLVSNDDTHGAMLEFGGWDTHNALVPRLESQFKELDAGLAALRSALADDWKNTVVAIGTEFGRTAAVNGTRGSDHGTASALFIAGGAVKGGKVMGDWPGLAKDQLYEGRDLRPTSDIHSWLSTLLAQHWGLNANQLQNVFPEVAPVAIQLLRT